MMVVPAHRHCARTSAGTLIVLAMCVLLGEEESILLRPLLFKSQNVDVEEIWKPRSLDLQI